MLAEAALAFAVTVSLAPCVTWALRRARVLDHPSDRSSHEQPTPRGGGLAPAAGALVAILSTSALVGSSRGALVAAGVALGLVGLADDLWGIPALGRLLLQALVALGALPWLLAGLGGATPWRVAFTVAVVVWLVAFVNAFNFMDGINGLSCAQAIVAGSAWWAIGEANHLRALAAGGAILAAVGLGFAPVNFPRARVFLGDVGSYFLGAWTAALVVLGLRAGVAPEAMLAPVSLYLADTAVTLVRRVRRGERWHEAHRSHTYQRLVARGWSHAATTGLVASIMTAGALLGAVSLGASLAARLAADAGIVALLFAYLISPGLQARTRSAATAA